MNCTPYDTHRRALTTPPPPPPQPAHTHARTGQRPPGRRQHLRQGQRPNGRGRYAHWRHIRRGLRQPRAARGCQGVSEATARCMHIHTYTHTRTHTYITDLTAPKCTRVGYDGNVAVLMRVAPRQVCDAGGGGAASGRGALQGHTGQLPVTTRVTLCSMPACLDRPPSSVRACGMPAQAATDTTPTPHSPLIRPPTGHLQQ
jgi:hypothetical protein